RHVVLVGLELGPLVADRVDDPQLADVALVRADQGEAARVLGPRDVGSRALVLVLLALGVRVAARAGPVAVVLLAVLGELDLLHLDGLLRLLRLLALLALAGV